MTDLPLLLTRQQAAELAGVKLSHLTDWTFRRDFPKIREGRWVRIHRDKFLTWLDTRAETDQRLAVMRPTGRQRSA